MIPKIIHLCWFGGGKFPIEIQLCIDSWKKILPDYTIRTWNYDDALSTGIPFVSEALEKKNWAFAADVVRFYAVWKEGGVYMDSDIMIYKRFDEFVPESGFATFEERIVKTACTYGLQAAFFMGEAGNTFCAKAVEYYKNKSYDQVYNEDHKIISPGVMQAIARELGYDQLQRNVMEARREETFATAELTIYPTRHVLPSKRAKMEDGTFARHCVYGNWRKRKFGRKVELFIKNIYLNARYGLLKR